jgi:hypothetical protein
LSSGLRHLERRCGAAGEALIHKLHILFDETEIAFRDLEAVLRSAQLHVALCQFGYRGKCNSVPVLNGCERAGVGCFYGPSHATEQV